MTETDNLRIVLPNPSNSRVVLIGVSDYSEMEELPAVRRNVSSLSQILTDPDLWGLPPENCVAMLNPTSVDAVLDSINAAAATATELLVIYFAGHGLLDERGELYLGLTGSSLERIYRAVRYDDIRREVIRTAAGCFGKVVILDCCYSGRALVGGMSGSVEIADQARVDGTYLMTASAERELAWAPQGEQYTAFSGVLIDKLRNGVPGGSDLVDMETLFYHIRAELQSRDLSSPQQRTRNDGRAIALARNMYGRRGAPDKVSNEKKTRALTQVPPECEQVLWLPPSEFGAQIEILRREGREEVVGHLLRAAAARRPSQEVAAIADLLRGQDQLADLATLIRAVTHRAPAHIMGVVEALRTIGLPADAAASLSAVARGPVEDTVELATLLQVRRNFGDLARLLDEALDTAQKAGLLTDLITGLWMAGFREQLDQLLQGAAKRLPAEATVILADELRAAGREQTAFRLYSVVADAVTMKPPTTVAELCAAMATADEEGHSEQIATNAIKVATTPEKAVGLVLAFWATGQEGFAIRALESAATMPVADINAMATHLRGVGREEAAYQLYVLATISRPPSEIYELIKLLRAAGRPVDAKNLFREVIRRGPESVIAALIREGSESDAQQALSLALERRKARLGPLVAALGSIGRQRAYRLMPSVEAIRIAHAQDLLTQVPDSVQNAYRVAPEDARIRQAYVNTLLSYGSPRGVREAYSVAIEHSDRSLLQLILDSGSDAVVELYGLAPENALVRTAYVRRLSDSGPEGVGLAFDTAADAGEILRAYYTELLGARRFREAIVILESARGCFSPGQEERILSVTCTALKVPVEATADNSFRYDQALFVQDIATRVIGSLSKVRDSSALVSIRDNAFASPDDAELATGCSWAMLVLSIPLVWLIISLLHLDRGAALLLVVVGAVAIFAVTRVALGPRVRKLLRRRKAMMKFSRPRMFD